ncbi:MAG: CBS domain-containing protein, partial [Sulfurovum sp.]
PEEFALYHPGGSLGRKLLTRVKDIMSSQRLPIIHPASSFQEIITTMTNGRLGLCIVMNEEKIEGIITDGDLRRALERTDKSRFDLIASEVMSKDPKTIDADSMAADAEHYMLQNKINELLVTEGNNLVGVIQLYDTGRIA